ncbi:MAG: hypothetical protein ACKVIO_00070 [Phycisphaerales bacterium]|jgi:hypothetical protein|tara:strand:+ start:1191 stop:1391 length:201 start_codon:yes stop_codon:yes gene_type:complete
MKDISLPQLGNMIEQNWRNIATLAKRSISSMKDGRSDMIVEFLEESKLWSGPTAKIIKDELIARLR